MPPPEDLQWFAENLHPHEHAVRAYLASRFPTLREFDDIVQDSYVRILRARRQGRILHARAFFFATAHNAAIDVFRRQVRSMPLGDGHDPDSTLDAQPGAAELMDGRLQREVLAEAVASLPERCREVVILRFQENLSYRQIAARLGVTTDTVKMQLGRGLRRCARFLARRDLLDAREALCASGR